MGSIPPGTINLSVLQLGLQGKIAIAWRFILVAALMEYPFAWLAISLESYLISTPAIVENFRLISALVMLGLGGLNIWGAGRPTTFTRSMENSGFRRGLVLALLNPMIIPFWLGVTAYLHSLHWIDFSSPARLHAYLAGVSVGAFISLILIAYSAKKLIAGYGQNKLIKFIPGIALLILGFYALAQYFVNAIIS